MHSISGNVISAFVSRDSFMCEDRDHAHARLGAETSYGITDANNAIHLPNIQGKVTNSTVLPPRSLQRFARVFKSSICFNTYIYFFNGLLLYRQAFSSSLLTTSRGPHSHQDD